MIRKIQSCLEGKWKLFGNHISGYYWDRLGPEIFCCSACTWTDISWSHGIQRNYKGLKITLFLCSWGKLWTTGCKKTQNPAATSEDLGTKAGYCACALHTAPPISPTHTYLHPIWETSLPLPPPQAAGKGNCWPVFAPASAAGAPVKPCLNFFSGLLSTSFEYGGQEPWLITQWSPTFLFLECWLL